MRLLIAVDSSPSSEAVIAETEARPWPEGTEAIVLSVVDTHGTSVMDTGSVLAMERESARQLVDRMAERLASAGISAIGDVIEARPRSVISAYAKESGADLIIMGSHGHSGLVRFLVGSVAKSVLRSAPCSVEIVRAALDDASHAKRMVVMLATDGSNHSQAAARSIASCPWSVGSEFKVVSFAEVPPFCLPPYAESELDSTLEALRVDIIRRAEQAVESGQAILKGAGLASIGAVAVGDPRTGILDEAARWGARLIVLGSHGVTGAVGVLPGSVAEAVALHSHCSVEVIRAGD